MLICYSVMASAKSAHARQLSVPQSRRGAHQELLPESGWLGNGLVLHDEPLQAMGVLRGHHREAKEMGTKEEGGLRPF